MKYNIILILGFLLYFNPEAQCIINKDTAGFHLQIENSARRGEKIYLGQYWNGQTYAKDSTLFSDKGVAIFNFDKEMNAGQYFLYIKPNFQIDFLLDVGQNNLKMYIDENNLSKSTITGSPDTELLWKYLDMMQKADIKKAALEVQLTDSLLSEKKRKEINTSLVKIEHEVQVQTDKLIKDNPNSWFTHFTKGMEMIKLPFEKPKNADEFNQNKQYGVDHFFDNINLQNPRFWHTNYLISYIDAYMRNWVEQVPDSLATAASRLVSKAKGNAICFENMLSYLTNQSIKSNVMGDENIWAKLYEDHIENENLPWIDSTQRADLKKMYEPIKNNRIGMQAHNLTLKTMSGQVVETNQIPSEYLILYFYDPHCGHCQTSVPAVYEKLYSKYKDKGLEIVAINISTDAQDWKKFIDEHQLTDWFNCHDPDYKSEYWMYYNTTGIPAVYVLNKNKTIIAKSIDEKNLEKLFDFYLNK